MERASVVSRRTVLVSKFIGSVSCSSPIRPTGTDLLGGNCFFRDRLRAMGSKALTSSADASGVVNEDFDSTSAKSAPVATPRVHCRPWARSCRPKQVREQAPSSLKAMAARLAAIPGRWRCDGAGMESKRMSKRTRAALQEHRKPKNVPVESAKLRAGARGRIMDQAHPGRLPWPNSAGTPVAPDIRTPNESYADDGYIFRQPAPHLARFFRILLPVLAVIATRLSTSPPDRVHRCADQQLRPCCPSKVAAFRPLILPRGSEDFQVRPNISRSAAA
jgi:hypothetical protein